MRTQLAPAVLGVALGLLAFLPAMIACGEEQAAGKETQPAAEQETGKEAPGKAPEETPAEAQEEAPQSALPRLVDLGAGKCIPCKRMAPILEQLREDYAGVVDVVFIDVWKDPNAGKPYKIRVIPTQVFYDDAGEEVFRHEGFFSRAEIEKVFQEKMGVNPIPPSEGKESPQSSGPAPRDRDSG